MNRKRLISTFIILATFFCILFIFRSINKVTFKLDTDKKAVSKIIIKSSKNNNDILVSNKNEITKIINYLNSIDYNKKTTDLKIKYDYCIFIVRGENNIATYLEVSNEYIMVHGMLYNSNDNIVSEIETIYNNYK
jgi:hypothetical protein